MKRVLILSALALLAVAAGCGSDSSTTAPPASSSGISGAVKYSGGSSGGILIYSTDKAPQPGEAPQPVRMSTFTSTSGEFNWDLPPGTYYVSSFLAVGREQQGPPQASEPAVNCDPIAVKEGEMVKVEVVLTDADAGGKNKSCLKKN